MSTIHSNVSPSDLTMLSKSIPGYELLELIGVGGFGKVYRASQASTGQIVALKLLQLDDTLAPSQRDRHIERFEREAQLCAQLRHPHIVRLLDKGQTADHQVFVVFEYVPGETLKKVLKRHGALSPQETRDLMGQVLDALACAHTQGVVHRDLKPQNIMITTNGLRRHATILDFGVAAFVPEARQSDYKTLTLTHEALGTPSYSSPEQLRGEPPTVKSDLYTWGLVFLECLTGQTVMHGGGLAEMLHKQLSSSEIALPPGIAGHPVAELLRRALRKNPRDRAEQADRLYADLQNINVNNLVGFMGSTWHTTSDDAPTAPLEYNPWHSGVQRERRQITVVCCDLRIFALGEEVPDLELLEALQRDQGSQLIDTSAKYGGHLIGSLEDSLMVCFGYPHVSDNDARRAVRAALEWVGQVQRRNPHLGSQQGVQLEIRISLHTGMVLIYQDSEISGITPQVARRLLHLAPTNGVLVSETSRRLLEPYSEFEAHASYPIGDNQRPIKTYLLQGERRTEALTFLPDGSVARPMIGRDEEFQQLIGLWNQAQQDAGQVAVVIGEAGIGKSRLIHELHRFVSDEGGLTRTCRCLPEHRNNALYPLLQMLQHHWGLSDINDSGESIQRLTEVLEPCETPIELALPILCSWLSLLLPESIKPLQHSPERQKQIFLEVLEELILSMGDGQPFLLIVEDLHWIDPTTLEFCERMIASAPHHRILLVHTARPEFSPPWQEEVTLLNLQRLTPSATEQLIQRVAGDQPVAPKTLDYLVQRTDGVPLFAEELVRTLLEDEVLVLQEGQHTLAPSFDASSIPVTLKDLLSGSLSRLGISKETAQVASAIGREFDYAVLVKASLRGEADVQTDLEAIVAAGLAFRQRRVQSESYIFKHALIRDAAYDSMLRLDREQAHSRIAETLETYFPEMKETTPGTIAQHYGHARQFEQAIEYGTHATRHTLERSLHDETIEHANQGMEWLQQLETHQPKKELAFNNMLTQALMAKHGWANEIVKEKVELSRKLIDLSNIRQNISTVPVLWVLAHFNYVSNNRQGLKQAIDELEQASEKLQDSGLRAATAQMKGMDLSTGGEYLPAIQAFKQGVEYYNPKQHHDHGMRFGIDTLTWGLAALGVHYAITGDLQAAESSCQESITWSKQLNHVPSYGVALLYQGVTSYCLGKKEETAQATEELISLAIKFGLPAYEGYASLLHSWAVNDQNIDQQQTFVRNLHQIGCRAGLPFYTSALAAIQAENGAYELALEQIDQSLYFCQEYNELFFKPELYRRRGVYLSVLRPKGDMETQETFTQAIKLAQIQGMRITEETAREALYRYKNM